MQSLGLWQAVLPMAAVAVLLTPLAGTIRLRLGWPWFSTLSLLIIATTLNGQCAARATATAEVERRLFPQPTSVVAVYDNQDGAWLAFSPDSTGASVDGPVRLLARQTATAQPTGATAGSASASGGIRVQLEGNPVEVKRLASALQLVASSRAGSAVLKDVLERSDVTISFTDNVGLVLLGGITIATGGTAVTEGLHVYLSRTQYGNKPVEVLAAMEAHELTHVAQNIASSTPWWEWPWATIDRELTAHTMQAIVWGEARGNLHDPEQDSLLRAAQNREVLRSSILNNAAYPWWLAPNLGC